MSSRPKPAARSRKAPTERKATAKPKGRKGKPRVRKPAMDNSGYVLPG